MFVLTFEAALFELNANNPALPALFQLPPNNNARQPQAHKTRHTMSKKPHIDVS